MQPRHHTGWLTIVLALLSAGHALARFSPTLDAINLARNRTPAKSGPAPRVTSSRPSRSAGRVTTIVRVTAPDPRVAQLTARTAAIKLMLQELVRGQRASQAERMDLQERVEALAALLASRQDQLDRLEARLAADPPERTETGDYSVTVRADAPDENLSGFILATAASPRTVVVRMSDRVDGAAQDDNLVDTLVAERLISRGIKVFLAPATGAALQAAALEETRQIPSLEAEAVDSLAEWVTDIRATTDFSQDNGGILSYTSRASVRLVNARTGEVGKAGQTKTVRGFALGKVQAAEKARREVALEIAAILDPELRRAPPSRITLNLPNDAGLATSVKQVLSGRDDFRMSEVREEREETHMVVESSQGTAALLSYLRRKIPELAIVPAAP